jgi:hypothetical protein
VQLPVERMADLILQLQISKLGEGGWGEWELLHPLIDGTKFGEMVQVIEMQNCDKLCGWCRHSLNNQFELFLFVRRLEFYGNGFLDAYYMLRT